MNKIINRLSISAALVLTLGLSSCESEKDLVIYDEDLPLISETLYMLGNAAPCGWSITDLPFLKETAPLGHTSLHG